MHWRRVQAVRLVTLYLRIGLVDTPELVKIQQIHKSSRNFLEKIPNQKPYISSFSIIEINAEHCALSFGSHYHDMHGKDA